MDGVCFCRDLFRDANLLRRWQNVGKSKGLATDGEIAAFLLNWFEKNESDAKHCSQCDAPLRLCCVQCQLLSQPPHPADSQLQVPATFSSQHTVLISDQSDLQTISSSLPTASMKKSSGEIPRADVNTFVSGQSFHTTYDGGGQNSCKEEDVTEIRAVTSASAVDCDEDNDTGDDMITVSAHGAGEYQYPDTSSQSSKLSTKANKKWSVGIRERNVKRQHVAPIKQKTNKRTLLQKLALVKTGRAQPADYADGSKLSLNNIKTRVQAPSDGTDGFNSALSRTLSSGGHSGCKWVKDEKQSEGETLETVPSLNASAEDNPFMLTPPSIQLHGGQCEHKRDKVNIINKANNISPAQSNKALSQCFSSIAIEPCCSEPTIFTIEEEQSSGSSKTSLPGKARPRKQGDGGKVTCTVCSSQVSKRYFRYHMETHGERKSFVCDICGAVYKQWRNLRIHHRTHSGEAPYRCNQCGASFKLGMQLKDHVSVKHTSVYTHVCQECGVGFNLPSRLKKHMRVHTGEKPHQCGDCGWRFSQISLLKTHWQAKHSGEKPFKCLECDAAYSNKHALSIHRRKHERQRNVKPVEKKYICDICGHASATATMLKTHMISHTDERPFTCQQCGSSYKTRLMLGRHIKLCGKEKPFECNICKARFTTKNSLKEHTNIHTGQNRYKCDFCNGEFNTRLGWKIHRRKHTGEKPYACLECGARFAAIAYLYSHRLTHSSHKPFACTLCDAKFARNNGLKNHMVVHSQEKAFECSVCGGRYPRQYYLKVHMRLKHTGEKPFRCTQCDSAFALTRDLKKHIQRVHTIV